MTTLIRQLPVSAALPLLAGISRSSPAELRPDDELNHPQSYILPTGGLPLSGASLMDLRIAIVRAAECHGFPDVRPSGFLPFELEVAEILATWDPLWVDGVPSGEALRNDCWSFLTIIVMPDVALWRWPAPSDTGIDNKAWKGRMLGGSRNTFQRIFRRVMCLDRGTDHPDRWGLIRELQEDDFSAILERPGLSSNRDIAVCLGEEYLAMKQRMSHRSADERQTVYRQATKAIRAYGVVQPLELLSPGIRAQLIHAAFSRCEDGSLPLSGHQQSAGSDAESFPDQTFEISGSPPPARPPRRSFLRRLLRGG